MSQTQQDSPHHQPGPGSDPKPDSPSAPPEEALRAVLARWQAVNLAVAQAATRAEVARVALEQAAAAVDAPAGCVAVLNADRTELQGLDSLGSPPLQAPNMPLMAAHPLAEAVRNAVPVWVTDRFAPNSPYPLLPDEPLRYPALAAIPLVARGQVLGGLLLGFAEPRPFPDYQRQMLVGLAAQCALALQRSALFDRLSESETRYRLLADAAQEGITLHERGVHVDVNEAFAHMLGYTRSEAIGISVRDLAAPESRPIILEHVESGSEEPYEVVGIRKDGSRIDLEVRGKSIQVGGRTLRATSLRDITEHKRTEQGLRFLTWASRELARTLDYEETLQHVAHLVVPTFADWCTVDILPEADGSPAVREPVVAHVDPAREAVLREMRRRFPPQPDGPSPASLALRTGRTVFLPRVDTSRVASTAVPPPEHVRMVQTVGVGPAIAVPLVARDRNLGVLTFANVSQARQFTAHEVALAEDLAQRAALAIDNARLFRAERTVRQQLETVLQGVQDGITVQTPDGRLLYANDAAARLVGFPSAAAMLAATPSQAMQAFDLLDENGLPMTAERLPGRLALNGQPVPMTPVRFRDRATGAERWSMVGATPIFNEQGDLQFAINIFHDVTEQQRVSRRLRFLAEAGERLPATLDVEQTVQAVLRLAINTLADGAIVVLPGQDGGEEMSSSAHREPARAALAQELANRYPSLPNQQSALRATLASGQPLLIASVSDADLVRLARDADQLALLRAYGVVSAVYTPLVARGHTLGVLGLFNTLDSNRHFSPDDLVVVEEIGQRAALAIDNAHLYGQAQAAVRARDEFLSIAAHELRTPITTVKGLTQLMRRARAANRLDEARLDRGLQQLDEGSNRLAQLVEDLLDVSRLQTGHLQLHLAPVDVSGLARRVADQFLDQLGPRVTLDVRCPDEDCVVPADAGRLEQVLVNLVGNAAKYSPNGGVVDVSVAMADGGALLEVRDHGIGLPPAVVESIFRPFGRAPNALARQIPGMGLGLYICREIVQRHGGRIWATSPGEDQGTTLHLWLPGESVTGGS